MAKLERVTAKVFASDAPADKIGQFGSALAGTKLETGDVSTIQALPAYTEGWSSAVISQRNYPVLQETNGVMKNMSYQTAYIMQNGIAEYDPDTEYYAGSICKGIGNTNQYASWGDENVGNAVTNSQYWKNVTPVNYSNITNCLLEVPQRIKLELNDGVLTLKAGSEVIVPNGLEEDGVTPKFDYVTVESDVSLTSSQTTGTRLGFITGNETFVGCVNTYMYSGDTAKMNSTSAVTYGRFYNTETNKIYVGNSNGGSWVETPGASLPICIFTNDANGVVTSLNQVFNGFGYIGATIWVDKGVKGLMPNGRNEDGSLDNIEFVTDKIFNINVNEWGSRNGKLILSNAFTNDIILNFQNYERFAGLSAYQYQYEYRNDNYWYFSSDIGSTWTSKQVLILSDNVTLVDGVVTSLTPKQPFRAVDYNDKPEISGWAMPSSKYINLTLGATGTTYTAPANGWVSFCKRATASAQEAELMALPLGQSVRYRNTSASGNFLLMVSLPVKKGQQFMVGYTAGGETEQFTFIYAEGEV